MVILVEIEKKLFIRNVLLETFWTTFAVIKSVLKLLKSVDFNYLNNETKILKPEKQTKKW